MKKVILAKNQKGSALTLLLVFTAIAMVVTTTSVSMAVISTQSSSQSASSAKLYYFAENGLESALRSILRDPLYSGETLYFEGVPVTIVVSGSTITATAIENGIVKKVQAQISTGSNGTVSILDWTEVN